MTEIFVTWLKKINIIEVLVVVVLGGAGNINCEGAGEGRLTDPWRRVNERTITQEAS